MTLEQILEDIENSDNEDLTTSKIIKPIITTTKIMIQCSNPKVTNPKSSAKGPIYIMNK